jgi:16S rRNA (guanine966-N2)-methyltransferase
LRRAGARFYSDGSQGYAVASKSGKNSRPARGPSRVRTAAQDEPRDGVVRVIGGQLRGRRISFPALPELRPTPDRLKETLYNWLQGHLQELRVLDLFAGSGGLGLEALSRGAQFCQFVEHDAAAVARLEETLARFALGSERARVARTDAFAWLEREAARDFGLVLLDPPFRTGWIPELCTLLRPAAGAWIYIESPAEADPPALPAGWERWRETRVGAARGTLARVTGDESEAA